MTEAELLARAWEDPQFESEVISRRPLRGKQPEIIKRIEAFVRRHDSGVLTYRGSRQTGKNEIAAVLQRRHLWRNQYCESSSTWIRTAPTYLPQIVNSKKRLREILKLSDKNIIRHPSFKGARLQKEEGYIWRVGSASVEFISSGPHANVVGGTASECLDMDEAHKIDKAKFDEDFAPFTANTSAGTILWGVAGNGLDTLQWYVDQNEAEGRSDLNLHYPCDVWMEANPRYRRHVEDRVRKLGWEHPIIKTQYRLIPVAAEGLFLGPAHQRAIFSGNHERQLKPVPGTRYEAVIDIAAGNEEFNPESALQGEEDTSTDSSVMWIYKVSPILSGNGLFPIIELVNLRWWTGAALSDQEKEIGEELAFWGIQKATIDGVGVGRQIAESMETRFTSYMVNKYLATEASVSEDCFDLLARLNHASVLMFRDDGSPEYTEFVRQVGWTRYASRKGRMKLMKPKSDQHIDMVKALTYIHQNKPMAGMHEIYVLEGDFSC